MEHLAQRVVRHGLSDEEDSGWLAHVLTVGCTEDGGLGYEPCPLWETDSEYQPNGVLKTWLTGRYLGAAHLWNLCDCCKKPGSPQNPVTIYPGAPADLENGPSAAEIPYTLCEHCEQHDPDAAACSVRPGAQGCPLCRYAEGHASQCPVWNRNGIDINITDNPTREG